MQQILSSR